MSVDGLDHVNLLTRDMDATVRFYTEALGLVAGDPASGLDPARLTWMYDAAGRALFHLTRTDELVLATTGAIDHVSLACRDHDAMTARLEALGIAYRCRTVNAQLRQVFVTDPGGVLLELNFRSGNHSQT